MEGLLARPSIFCYNSSHRIFARVAQLVEHFTRNEEVASSILASGSKTKIPIRDFCLLSYLIFLLCSIRVYLLVIAGKQNFRYAIFLPFVFIHFRTCIDFMASHTSFF
jgi:hypothetical protein